LLEAVRQPCAYACVAKRSTVEMDGIAQAPKVTVDAGARIALLR
jgi:hypothetical protein